MDKKEKNVKLKKSKSLRTSFRAGPLHIPSEVKDPNKRYVWDHDDPHSVSYRLEMGYRPCVCPSIKAMAGDKVINEDTNKEKQIVRTGRDGKRLVLFEIDRATFEEIKEDLAKMANENENQTKANAQMPGTYGHNMQMSVEKNQFYED